LQLDYLIHRFFQFHFSDDGMGSYHRCDTCCKDSEVHAVANFLWLLWTLLTQEFLLNAMTQCVDNILGPCMEYWASKQTDLVLLSTGYT
jgi:hypothetical protein